VIDFISAETDIAKDKIKEAAADFRITELLYRHIVSLSTGEGRRILLLILWLTDRKVFLFDDPYSGLDKEGKELVTHIFEVLSEKDVTIIVTCTSTDHPAVFDHILYIKDHHVAFAGRSHDFRLRREEAALKPDRINLNTYLPQSYDYDFLVAAGMNDITVRYDTNTVLKNFSWTISRGDKWLLTGRNGSGKSTLMSMIYADNPMAYACELVVFDRVRGTGESIWEIKSRMGYFSSELQQFFPRTFTLREAVLSGFSDHLIVRKDLTTDHFRQADELIEVAGLKFFADTPLYRLSFSICRLALVCRALVKHPPVVILDEPCQGLDLPAMQMVHRLVGALCDGKDKTLIYVTNQADDVPGIIDRRKGLTGDGNLL
jgi:molybdate transport system ATP-binding protein